MISFRKYLGIIIMMTVLFVIFVFSVIVNEQGSFYDINEYVMEERPSGVNRWTADEAAEQVVLIGNGNQELNKVLEQWCLYTKRSLVVLEQLGDYEKAIQGNDRPAMVLLAAEQMELTTEIAVLEKILSDKVPIVFCSLPTVSQLIASLQLREILGVEAVAMQETKIRGVRLFDGFFLGGPAEYEAKKEDEEKRQDLSLQVPWYVLSGGTKTYMVGIKNEGEVRNVIGLGEEAEGVTGYFPSLIWRNSHEGTMVFAVCGDYMSSVAGLGILNTFCYELKQYELYPVVNAQSVLIHNFPNLSAENDKKILEVYSRSPQMYFQGIMWPSLSAMAKTNELKLTCFVNPQYDYVDVKVPQKEELIFYLKQLRELKSEAGMAVSYREYSSFETMLKEDTAFYESLNSNYRYQTLFTEEKDLSVVEENLAKNSRLQQVVTVGSRSATGGALFSYLTDDVTLQRTTGIAEKHSYMDDFEVRGIETALMYSNILVDLHDAVWPQKEEDEWQHLYDTLASNVQTYWYPYRGYEQTTLSESDYRVRTLLNLDYAHEREKNIITLQVENAEDGAFFLLRTHDEKITEIKGGEYEKLEKDAYLIKTMEDVVEITVEPLSLKEQKEK